MHVPMLLHRDNRGIQLIALAIYRTPPPLLVEAGQVAEQGGRHVRPQQKVCVSTTSAKERQFTPSGDYTSIGVGTIIDILHEGEV